MLTDRWRGMVGPVQPRSPYKLIVLLLLLSVGMLPIRDLVAGLVLGVTKPSWDILLRDLVARLVLGVAKPCRNILGDTSCRPVIRI